MARFSMARTCGAVAFGHGDANAGGGVVADDALFHRVTEEGAEHGDVLANPGLAEQPAGAARVLLLVHPANERLHVAWLDLGEAQANAAVEVGDDPRLEHLRVGAAGRSTEAVGRAALVVDDPLARVVAEGHAGEVAQFAAFDVDLGGELAAPSLVVGVSTVFQRCTPRMR
jgi:hypothetical protein